MRLGFFRVRDVDTERMKNEYERMVQGLRDAHVARETDVILANPGTSHFKSI